MPATFGLLDATLLVVVGLADKLVQEVAVLERKGSLETSLGWQAHEMETVGEDGNG